MKKISLYIVISLILLLVIFLAKSQPKAQAATIWKFVAYGDNRTNLCDHASVLTGIQSKVPDRLTVLDVGDLTAGGTTGEMRTAAATCLGHTYNGWEGMVSQILGVNWSLKTNPPDFAAAMGNHEYLGDWSNWMGDLKQKNLSAYPDVPVTTSGTYGSFKINNALFIWLDPVSSISAQNTFLTSTFQKAAVDSSVKWRFVFLHNPENSCGGSHPGIDPQTQAWHDNYFVPNKVDVVFSGHNHYYERSCALVTAAGTCDQKGSSSITDAKGAVEIITGSGGAPMYAVGTNCSWLEKAVQYTLEFVEVQVLSDNQIKLNVWTPSNLTTPIDSLVITKSALTLPPTLSKAVDKSISRPGDILNYTLTYSSQTGNQNVRVEDSIPIGSVFKSVSDGGVLSGNTITWNLGSLAAGATGNLHFSVEIP